MVKVAGAPTITLIAFLPVVSSSIIPATPVCDLGSISTAEISILFSDKILIAISP